MKLLNTLFEITIYSAVLFAAVTGFKLAFKNKLSPALHFTLWFLVIARLCIPVTIESGFHLFTVEQEKPLVQQQIPEASIFDAPTPAATREAAPSEALRSEAPAPVQEPLPAADSPKPVFTIASAGALIALWVAGMAFRAAALLFGERRLRLAMAHNTLPTDARTRDIYDACCAELGIAHKLPLQSMAGIYSPALTVSLKPMILLPANITDTLTDAQLACALRHELTHYRRRDHLLMLLLRLLTCVYWFNPIVWLMKRELMKDMETACDSAVTARLNGTERREYAMTLLALFSQPCRANSVLGMALSSAEKDAERRVRGVFGAHRSKAPVKILAALLSALLLACCFTTACQPTPEKEIVMGEDGIMDYSRILSDISTSYVKEEALPDGIHLKVQAEVIKPDDELCIGIIERYPFDAAMVEKVGDILWGSAPMYVYYESKRELAEYIVTCRAQIDAAKDFLGENDVAYLEMTLNDMEKALPGKPDAGKPASYSKIFGYDNGFIKVDTGKNAEATFQALADGYRNILSFMDIGFKKHLIEYIEPLRVTEEEVVKQAEEILENMGLAGQFGVVKTGIWPVNHTIVDQMLEDKGYAFQSRHQRRYVIFMRKIGNANQVYSEQIQRGATDGGYGAAVFWELMEMQFDNDGLVSFNWQEPGNVRITEENVSVIDLDTAYEAMLSYMQSSQNRYAYEEYGISSDRVTISINRIELGMSCIAGKNKSIEAVPVWEFFGEIEYEDTRGKITYVNTLHHKITDETRGCNSICTINAITGKRIDRGLGY